ncbi:sporulation protein [Desulfobacterales bacterium HSG2]|nr:sporulation protein [Desulfobacterales bacterium HSG2]
MSLFNRILSSIGIGSAKVDTVLQGNRFAPGETIDAVVNITGGKTEQDIGGLYFSLYCSYKATVEVRDEEGETGESEITKTLLLDKFKLSDPFVIGPKEEKDIPLSFTLPLHTPLTLGKTKVLMKTGLDIKKAIDSEDKDYVEVVPNALVGSLFDALQEMGFRLMTADCETASSKTQPLIQEFEFMPFSGPFRSKLDELEVICFPKEDCVEVLMETDRKARGFIGFIMEALDRDETRVKFTFCSDDIPGLTDRLYEIIDKQGG